MVFILDAAGASNSRFGFSDHSSDPVNSDLLLRSVSKDSHSRSHTLAVRSNTDQEEGHPPESSSQSFDFSEDPSFWKDHNVQEWRLRKWFSLEERPEKEYTFQVVVRRIGEYKMEMGEGEQTVIIRLRPLNSTELSLQGYNKCIRQESCQSITWTGHPESRFTFDIVADENVSQENLFKVAGVPMVENCVGGYNSCMFAYGQTGSGKTHTMLGDIEGGTRRHSVNCGMTPRVFEYLFSRIKKEKEVRKDEKLRFTCKCSFLEIYNEHILDLLDPSSNNLQIREDNKKGVYVENLKETEVTSAREVILQLVQGAANRKVAATNMNRASSRSHSVFTCVIESKWEVQGVTHHRFARLNLVDLAGSERQKSSGAEGERLKEATNINKSLSTLGLVIMNLVSISNGKSQHVPYRDSKLTFLLQDSLGGNSKTTIIANISPSSCCSLETLSTLKFAQRAKFIKNNAIINEDASGDVISMRIQIQQLKKEVSRLRNLVNGAENMENNVFSNFLGSPGPFKWEGLQGSFSPLTCDKRKSQKNEYEVALAGAFRRAKDKETELQALTSQCQAALQLAKQREDELQGLKMRLRFREAGVKRLEAVVSGNMSAETHLLKEKEEQLQEIEVLRSQVDRNQEVTRFAMENLRLKEEIRRLKSFVEEGEQERMKAQISMLEEKLLEALDWKLMHESNELTAQRPSSPLSSSINEEMEFLQLQAIQNQSELDRLRKKLDICLEEKDLLQRHANDLAKKLDEERSLNVMEGSSMPIVNFGDQMELKKMVDAIASASEREAKAHERAITLSKENDELRKKFKVLIDDNNKLIELHEQATAEKRSSDSYSNVVVGDTQDMSEETKRRVVVENLENQLAELNEENEKLMSLYEKAMQERDDFKRMLSLRGGGQAMTEYDYCPEKLVGVDQGGKQLESEELLIQEGNGFDCSKALIVEFGDETEKLLEVDEGGKFEQKELLADGDAEAIQETAIVHVENPPLNDCFEPEDPPSPTKAKVSMDETARLMKLFLFDESEVTKEGFGSFKLNAAPEPQQLTEDHQANMDYSLETEVSDFTTAPVVSQEIGLVKINLENAEVKLKDTARNVAVFGSAEKAVAEEDELSRQIEEMGRTVEAKQREVESLKNDSLETKERADLTLRKLFALKNSLARFVSSIDYFEQREARARGRVNAASSYLDQKKLQLSQLQGHNGDLEAVLKSNRQTEEETKKKMACLRLKLEEEKRKQESDKVLFSIENVYENADPLKKNWHLEVKASDLLKSEEEKTKLQMEIEHCQERLGAVRKEVGELKKKQGKLEEEILRVEVNVSKGLKSVGELEIALNGVLGEKESILEMREKGVDERESVFVEYHQHVFEADLKVEEMKVLEEELQLGIERMQKTRGGDASRKKIQVLEAMRDSFCGSENIAEEVQIAAAMIEEARSFLNI